MVWGISNQGRPVYPVINNVMNALAHKNMIAYHAKMNLTYYYNNKIYNNGNKKILKLFLALKNAQKIYI